MEGETLDSPSMSSKDDGNSDTLPTQMETWDHFTPYTDSNGKTTAECKYCERTYAAGPSMNVTSEMNNHTKTCKNHPDNQTIASSCGSVNEESRESWKFDQEATRKALARMIIIDELPFKFVESEGFRQFVAVACPEFIVPSRIAVIGDCYRIFTITVDNASSNDTIVAYLRRKFVNQGTAILGGKFLHMRCVAHIINLIVKDGLKELNESIERVRTVVRYEMSDADFRGDFMPDGPYGKIGLPTKYDWDMMERFVKVLQYFYKLIVQISGSFYVTSNMFLDEISEVDYKMNEWLRSDDDILVDMARQIKVKFDKYWGDVEKMNMMLYVAVMLDPCLKFSYVEYVLKNMYGPERGEQMGNLAKSVLCDVFEEYKKLHSSTTSHSSCTTPSEPGHDDLTETMVIRARRKKKYQQMISEIKGMEIGVGHLST
ncbi:Zinc finger BED domain-containing protein RICESLEEPER 2 [Sesamum angolense]|uniref:Zinc finger BED domain-containing protein RICESLEEPER 2 n=1 Tax=Sesamum angolense TaxID=2727404 RepID=A0AAE2BZU6_9LAMI|nr:Zinc finger BED domain-containing protein RICESLEEPER 2 [Sesamum angolense]